MAKVCSLTTLLEEAAYIDSSSRNAIGSFRSLSALLESAVALQALHAGLFAFLAFHPTQDHAISDYIQNGSIGSDSGMRIMVLLLASRECDQIEELTPSLLIGNVSVNYAVNPGSELVERIFPGKPVPVLPGLLFFDEFYDIGNAVYVSLRDYDTAREVAETCRKCFRFAEHAYDERSSTPWTDTLSARLVSQNIPFERSGAMHGREWLAHALNLGRQVGAVMISLVPDTAAKLLGPS